MSILQVTLLRCSECGGELHGLGGDKVFSCPKCCLGVAIQDGKKEKYPIKFCVKENSLNGEMLYLPVWEFSGKVDFEDRDSLSGGREYLSLDINRVFVAGFSTRRSHLHGDIGLMYTEKRVVLSEDKEKRSWMVVGISRGPQDAEKHLNVMIKMIVDKRVDVTGLGISFEPSSRRLWAIPFEKDQEKVRDLIMGQRFSAHWIENVKEIMEAQQSAKS